MCLHSLNGVKKDKKIEEYTLASVEVVSGLKNSAVLEMLFWGNWSTGVVLRWRPGCRRRL